MHRNYDYILKICLLGESSVGKTCLLRRYADDEFDESTLATIGVDFRFKYAIEKVDPSTSTTNTLNYSCGTLLARNAFDPSLKATIGTQMPLSWFMTPQTLTLSPWSNSIGWLRSAKTQRQIACSFYLPIKSTRRGGLGGKSRSGAKLIKSGAFRFQPRLASTLAAA